MSKNLLVSYLFPTTNKKNHCYVQQFCFLEKVIEENHIEKIYYISLNETNIELNKILKLSKFKYPEKLINISLGKIYKDLLKTKENYFDISEELINYIKSFIGGFNPEDELYLFGGILLKNKEIEKIYLSHKDNLSSSNYIYFRTILIKIFIFYRLINELELNTNHIVFDPLELDFSNKSNYKKFHNYDDHNLKLNRLDSLQYQLLNKEALDKNFFLSSDLDLDFVFGASIIEKSRADLHPLMEKLLDLSRHKKEYKIFYQNKFIPKYNTFLCRPKYLELIKRAKYTLVIKAYEKNSFSASRFIESIYYGCVPLLEKDSNYHLLESLGFNIEWIEKYLVISNISEIEYKINSLNYREIINYLFTKLFNSPINF